MSLEERLQAAVIRAYDSAGVRPSPREVTALAKVYAHWAEGSDEGVARRVETQLAAFLRGGRKFS
jgi:hypothetical protein